MDNNMLCSLLKLLDCFFEQRDRALELVIGPEDLSL